MTWLEIFGATVKWVSAVGAGAVVGGALLIFLAGAVVLTVYGLFFYDRTR